MNSFTTETSAEPPYRIIAIEGGMITAIPPEDASTPAAKLSL